jgi:hypothetical protein
VQKLKQQFYKSVAALILLVSLLGILFSGAAAIFTRHDHINYLGKVLSGAIFGVFAGAVFWIEMKFQGASVAQIVCGIIGAVCAGLIGILLGFLGLNLLIFVIVGLFLGVTSKYWIYYLNFP